MQNTPPPENGKLKDRLAWARARAGLTQQELAKKSGIAQSTIASWENGARETGRKITVLAETLGVDPLWLADGGGKGPALAVSLGVGKVEYRAEAIPDKLQALIVLGAITEREAVLLRKFRSASDDGKDDIEMIANAAEKAALSIVYHDSKT